MLCAPPLIMDLFRSQGLKSVVYGGMIVAIMVVFVIQFGPNNQKQTTQKHGCIAEVRGVCVSDRDYSTTLRLIAGGADDETITQFQLKRWVVEGLVERELLVQDAARLGLSISDKDLNRQLIKGQALVSISMQTPPIVAYRLGLNLAIPFRNIAVKGADGKFDKKTYEQSLNMALRRSPQEFREMQEHEMLAQRMRDMIRSRVRISDGEGFELYKQEKSKASIKYVVFDRSWFAKKLVPSTDKDVQDWAKTHNKEIEDTWKTRQEKFKNGCRKTRHILVKVSETASDEAKSEAKKKIEAALKRVKDGESFAKVAEQTSEGPTGPLGGYLGCVVPGSMVKPFEMAMMTAKEGAVTGIVTTQFGYHILLVDKILKEKDSIEAGRSEIAKNLMLGMEGESKAASAAKQVREGVAAGKSLEEATKTVIDALLASVPKEKSEKEKTKDSEDKTKKNKDDKKDKGEKKEEKPKEPEPKDDTAPHIEDASDFGPTDSPLPGVAMGTDVAALVFQLKKVGETPSDVIRMNQGYAVIQLSEKKSAKRADFDKDKGDFLAQLLAAKQQDSLVLYVKRLKDAAKKETKIAPGYGQGEALKPGNEKGKTP
jgi:peptidyl-prolyl cis-trans isomerase D